MRKCLLILFFAFAAAGASAAQIDTVAVFSAKMQREIPALVVVPDAGVGRRMPVLYLLHGFGGSYTTWQNITDLRPLADACGMIVVSPTARTVGIGTVPSIRRRSSRPSWRRNCPTGSTPAT